MSQRNETKTPAPELQGVGKCLLPGEPGYDEALKRIQAAKKARDEQAKEKPTQ